MALQLDLSLKQQLKLSPQLIQSFALMALPLTELQQRVQTAIETNPTLEMPDSSSASSLDDYADYDEKKDNDDYNESSPYDGEASDRMQRFMENQGEKESLQDHLLSQYGCLRIPEETYVVGKKLITGLDDNGFFTSDPEELLKEDEKPLLPQTLSILQTLDPVGVCVRDWKESLIVQAKAKGLKDEEMELFSSMVHHYLPLLRSGKDEQVAESLHTDKEEIDSLFDFLKTLTPFPGQDYASGPSQYVVPDLSIHQRDGNLVLSLNDFSLPSLTIDPMYQDMAKTTDEKETKRYLQEQLRDANLLISQIEMRNQTLLKVGKVLLAEQKEFFLNGPKFLKPLTQKEVADQIGVHETTVSRISTAKWIDTDWGLIPIKNLFSNAVGGGDQSKNSVKEVVREIIQGNTTGKPLSDQKISDLLLEKGIKVARRTVAKYRGELNIDSSFVRGPGDNQ